MNQSRAADLVRTESRPTRLHQRRAMAIPPSLWIGLRLGVAGAVLMLLLRSLGSAPFLTALQHTTVAAVAIALATTLLTTLCCVWRWTWIARRLGLRLDLRSALPAYYRSQFLNVTLPGGVLGDVHRAVRHGGQVEALARATRAVAWERVVGQVALVALTTTVVVTVPSVLQGGAAVLAVVVLALGAGVALALVGLRRGRPSVGGRLSRTVVADVRRIVTGGFWLPITLSTVAAAGHLLVLFVAMRTAGVDVPLVPALPLLLTVLLASSLPTNLAGWGPREGMAAWVFAAAGPGAAEGVTVAAVYGVLALAAALPGALILLLDAVPRRIGVGSA